MVLPPPEPVDDALVEDELLDEELLLEELLEEELLEDELELLEELLLDELEPPMGVPDGGNNASILQLAMVAAITLATTACSALRLPSL